MTTAIDTIGGSYLVEGQSQKEARSNEWFDQLAENLAGYLPKDVAGSGTVTLTDTIGGEAHHAVLVFTGTLSGNRTVEVPAATRIYVVHNATDGAFTLTVQPVDGSGVEVAQDTWAVLVCDGADLTAPFIGAGGSVTPGPPLSVARYAADGATLEATPGLTTTSDGRLGVGMVPDSSLTLGVVGTLKITGVARLHMVQEDESNLVINPILYANTTPRIISLQAQRANGTAALPQATAMNQPFFRLIGKGHDGSSFPSGARTWIDLLGTEAWTPTAQGSAITFNTTLTGTLTQAERLRIDGTGNLTMTGAEVTSGMQRGLALGPGVAPSTSPPDTVQFTAVDRNATPGTRSLAIRTEDGTSHILGDLSGIGTLLTTALGAGASYQALTVNGSLLTVGQSSVQERPQALVNSTWVVSTDATRTARLTLSAYDATAAREGLRIEADGTAARIGFLGAAAVVRQPLAVAASDPATTQTLANSLRSALIAFGLCV